MWWLKTPSGADPLQEKIKNESLDPKTLSPQVEKHELIGNNNVESCSWCDHI